MGVRKSHCCLQIQYSSYRSSTCISWMFFKWSFVFVSSTYEGWAIRRVMPYTVDHKNHSFDHFYHENRMLPKLITETTITEPPPYVFKQKKKILPIKHPTGVKQV